MVQITAVPIREDNFVWVIHDRAAGVTAVVDPGESDPVMAVIDRDFGGRLDLILNTHHHGDHTGGNLALKSRYGSRIIGHEADRARLPGLDVGLEIGESFPLGTHNLSLIDCRGHTRAHIAFYDQQSQSLFCGDALFSLGCGRLFEGTAAEAWESLLRLRSLAAATMVYCGHEYTASNGVFALALDPDNHSLQQRLAEVARLRSQGLATVPSQLGEESRLNPFLRADDRDFARQIIPRLASLGVELTEREIDQPVAVFAALRCAKDQF